MWRLKFKTLITSQNNSESTSCLNGMEVLINLNEARFMLKRTETLDNCYNKFQTQINGHQVDSSSNID